MGLRLKLITVKDANFFEVLESPFFYFYNSNTGYNIFSILVLASVDLIFDSDFCKTKTVIILIL